jgi:hypothetical protein
MARASQASKFPISTGTAESHLGRQPTLVITFSTMCSRMAKPRWGGFWLVGASECAR